MTRRVIFTPLDGLRARAGVLFAGVSHAYLRGLPPGDVAVVLEEALAMHQAVVHREAAIMENGRRLPVAT